MLIFPPGHGQAVDARRALPQRERWMVGGALLAVAAVILVLLISIGSGGKTSGHGCIYATVPGPVGAEEISGCGAEARATCQSARAPGAFTADAARVVIAQCRKAGLPVG